MEKEEKRKLGFQIVLILMAFYFSLLENLVPKPFPWMKLGLANIASIVGIDRYGIIFGLEITVFRIITAGFVSGNLLTPGFFISISAGIASTFISGILMKYKENISKTAVSSVGGLVHNSVQLMVAYFMFFRNIPLNERGVLIFIALFLAAGFISGIITGIFAIKYGQ